MTQPDGAVIHCGYIPALIHSGSGVVIRNGYIFLNKLDIRPDVKCTFLCVNCKDISFIADFAILTCSVVLTFQKYFRSSISVCLRAIASHQEQYFLK